MGRRAAVRPTEWPTVRVLALEDLVLCCRPRHNDANGDRGRCVWLDVVGGHADMVGAERRVGFPEDVLWPGATSIVLVLLASIGALVLPADTDAVGRRDPDVDVSRARPGRREAQLTAADADAGHARLVDATLDAAGAAVIDVGLRMDAA